jgi:hypothetical protein
MSRLIEAHLAIDHPLQIKTISSAFFIPDLRYARIINMDKAARMGSSLSVIANAAALAKIKG